MGNFLGTKNEPSYIPQLEEGVFLDFRRAKLQGLKLLR